MDKFANVISDMTIRLRDSRTMGVLTTGDANGFPLFHFHGSTVVNHVDEIFTKLKGSCLHNK